MFLVLERYLAIRYPKLNMFFKRIRTQIILAIFIIFFNFIYYLPVLLNYDLDSDLSICYIQVKDVYSLVLRMEMIQLLVLPVSLIFLFIILIITFIIITKTNMNRSRIVTIYPTGEFNNSRPLSLAKYLTYLKVTLFLNLVYFSFNFPHIISDSLCNQPSSFQISCYLNFERRITNYLMYSLHGSQLIVYLIICKPVRQEFLLMLGFKKKHYTSQFNFKVALNNMINSVLFFAFSK